MFAWKDFPETRPKYLRDKLVLAWVAYHSQQEGASRGKAECHLAIRHLEMIFSFSSQSVAEACLNRLKRSASKASSGWIVVSTAASGLKGHRYRIGARAKSNASQWVDVGQMLFGPGGLLEPYRTRPVFTGKGLGPEGCVVLAAIDKCGPIGKRELITLLSTYISASTVKKNTGYLLSEGLVIEKDKKLFTSRLLVKKIDEFEVVYDLVDNHVKHHQNLLSESLAYQVALNGGPELVTLIAALRKLPCIYCKELPPPTGGDYEHFPPKKWGGSDKLSLLVPACIRCNRSHGPLIARGGNGKIEVPESAINFVTEMRTDEFRYWLADQMLLRAHHYATALNNRDIESAYAIATSDFPVLIWLAMRAGRLNLVNQSTGEIVTQPLEDSSPDVRNQLAALSGLTRIMESK
jgi:hypothetical protein